MKTNICKVYKYGSATRNWDSIYIWPLFLHHCIKPISPHAHKMGSQPAKKKKKKNSIVCTGHFVGNKEM